MSRVLIKIQKHKLHQFHRVTYAYTLFTILCIFVNWILYPEDLCEAKKVTNCIEQIKGGAVAQCGFLLHYILIRIIHF